MPYRIEIPPRVKKEIAKLNKENQRRVAAELDKLIENPRHAECKKLVGMPHYRVKAGDYRIVYSIEDEVLTVFVVKVRKRDEVYKSR